MDILLGLLGIAVSAGSLVQAFTHTDLKLKAMSAMMSVAIVGVTAAFISISLVKADEFNDARNKIKSMFASDNPMSIDQILMIADRVPRGTVNAVVDDLIDRGDLHSKLARTKDASGREYAVRVYNGSSYPSRNSQSVHSARPL
jgi:hypothetical protein